MSSLWIGIRLNIGDGSAGSIIQCKLSQGNWVPRGKKISLNQQWTLLGFIYNCKEVIQLVSCESFVHNSSHKL